MHSFLLLALAAPILAAPAPAPVEQAAHPMITARASLTDRDLPPTRASQFERRDILGSFLGSLVSDLGSAVPSYVLSGVPNFFQDFPTGGAVLSKLDMKTSDLDAVPTSALNVP